MALCALCEAITTGAAPLAPVVAAWDQHHSYLSGTDFLVASLPRDAPAPAEPIGRTNHGSLAALAASAAAGCGICALVHARVAAFIAHFQALARDSAEFRYYYIERQKHGLPREHRFYVTMRPDEGDGFLVWMNSASERIMYLVASIGFCVGVSGTDPPEAALLRGVTVDSEGGSERSLARVARWVKDCVTNHECCHGRGGSLPSRILDLEALGDPEKICLRETNDEQGNFVALSHCWGTDKASHLMTTRATLANMVSGIAVASLPPTFRDAVKVTRYLGQRYLWIDSLCICQDDVDDWARESAAMRSIYTCAYVTIAADRAGGNSDGFFTRPERQYVPISLSAPAPQVTSFNPSIDASSKMLPAFAFPVPNKKASSVREWLVLSPEPLSKRAWTLQERMLPHRILHFASDQTYFECNHSFVSEDGFSMSGRYLSLYPDEREAGYQEIARLSRHSMNHQLWYLLLETFTGRALTVDSDRLPAISGLARLFETRLRELSRRNKVQYLAGLWSDSLIEGLGWQVIGIGRTRGKQWSPPPPMPSPGSRDYWAPSWSWASFDGHSAHGVTQPGWEDVAAVSGWSVRARNAANPYGEAADGWLALRAPRLLPLAPSGEPENDADMLPSSAWRVLRLCLPRGDAYGSYTSFDHTVYGSEEARAWASEAALLLLLLSKINRDEEDGILYSGLIVEEVPSWSGGGPPGKRYRRLGRMLANTEHLGDDAATIEDQGGFVDIILV